MKFEEIDTVTYDSRKRTLRMGVGVINVKSLSNVAVILMTIIGCSKTQQHSVSDITYENAVSRWKESRCIFPPSSSYDSPNLSNAALVLEPCKFVDYTIPLEKQVRPVSNLLCQTLFRWSLSLCNSEEPDTKSFVEGKLSAEALTAAVTFDSSGENNVCWYISHFPADIQKSIPFLVDTNACHQACLGPQDDPHSLKPVCELMVSALCQFTGWNKCLSPTVGAADSGKYSTVGKSANPSNTGETDTPGQATTTEEKRIPDDDPLKKNVTPVHDENPIKNNSTPILDKNPVKDNVTPPILDINTIKVNVTPTMDENPGKDSVPPVLVRDDNPVKDNSASIPVPDVKPVKDNVTAIIDKNPVKDNVTPVHDENSAKDNDMPVIDRTAINDNVTPVIDVSPVKDNVTPGPGENPVKDNVTPAPGEYPVKDNVTPVPSGYPVMDSFHPVIDTSPGTIPVKSSVNEKLSESEDDIPDIHFPQSGNPDVPTSGHFFAYFLTAVVICISGYVIFHNKQKIIAIFVEGRNGSGGGRRKSGGPSYTQLKSHVEEVMPSLETEAANKHFVY